MNMTTLYSWDSLSVLRLLDTAAKRLAVLEAAGVSVPIFEVERAREILTEALVKDVAAMEIEAPVLEATE